MPLRAVVYVSSLVDPSARAKVQGIVAEAAEFNQKVGVSGALLFDGERFLQYFEGPREGVQAVYERIQRSRSHCDLLELAATSLSERAFPSWSMHGVEIAPFGLSRMVAGDWVGFIRRSIAEAAKAERLRAAAAPGAAPLLQRRAG